ncbi:MAG: hypothetical protein V3U83_00305, partial [Acidobacteriota bacterium]
MFRNSHCVTACCFRLLVGVLVLLLPFSDPVRSQEEPPAATITDPTGGDDVVPTIRIEGDARRKISIA